MKGNIYNVKNGITTVKRYYIETEQVALIQELINKAKAEWQKDKSDKWWIDIFEDMLDEYGLEWDYPYECEIRF